MGWREEEAGETEEEGWSGKGGMEEGRRVQREGKVGERGGQRVGSWGEWGAESRGPGGPLGTPKKKKRKTGCPGAQEPWPSLEPTEEFSEARTEPQAKGMGTPHSYIPTLRPQGPPVPLGPCTQPGLGLPSDIPGPGGAAKGLPHYVDPGATQTRGLRLRKGRGCEMIRELTKQREIRSSVNSMPGERHSFKLY